MQKSIHPGVDELDGFSANGWPMFKLWLSRSFSVIFLLESGSNHRTPAELRVTEALFKAQR